jgi:hypothetical protein
VRKSLSESDLPGPLKAIAIDEWNKRQEEAFKLSTELGSILKNSVDTTHKYATTEADTRCMLSVLNAKAFDKIEKMDWVSGWFNKQKEAMVTNLLPSAEDGSNIVDRISRHVQKKAKQNLASVCTAFMGTLVAELELFDQHISERLPPEYELNANDLDIRDSLKSLLPELDDDVAHLSATLEAHGSKRNRDIDGEGITADKRPKA